MSAVDVFQCTLGFLNIILLYHCVIYMQGSLFIVFFTVNKVVCRILKRVSAKDPFPCPNRRRYCYEKENYIIDVECTGFASGCRSTLGGWIHESARCRPINT
jgi:hypothetical protein